MAYCIRTFIGYTENENDLSKKFDKFSDAVENFKNWIFSSNWKKIFIPIYFIYFGFMIIVAIIFVIIYQKKLFDKIIIFQEGKKYETAIPFENHIIVKNTNRIEYFFYIKSHIFKKTYWVRPKYSDYFVDDIKQFRKIKLKKIEKI